MNQKKEIFRLPRFFVVVVVVVVVVVARAVKESVVSPTEFSLTIFHSLSCFVCFLEREQKEKETRALDVADFYADTCTNIYT